MASNSASDIVDAVGGPGNIASLTHCAQERALVTGSVRLGHQRQRAALHVA